MTQAGSLALQHLLIRGNHTNNYSESGIKIFKELVFGRVKAYNLIEMVTYVIDTMEMYYQRRLIHLAIQLFYFLSTRSPMTRL